MSSSHQTSLGVCIGASTVSAVWIKENHNQTELLKSDRIPHHGHPKSVLKNILNENNAVRICVTGRKFRSLVNLSSISEPEAVEIALEHTGYQADMVISIGGENFIVYELDSNGKIAKPITGNKCASGTGEFFLQQIKRMNLEVDEAVSLAVTGEPYHISGRCSVFCKSDCTHALNKGIPKADVTAGLSKMIAQKVIELTAKSTHKKILLIGAVSQNKAMVKYLRESFAMLQIPAEANYFEALGAAIYAMNNKTVELARNNLFKSDASSFSFHPCLREFTHRVHFKTFRKNEAKANDEVILGLDVGSTTTKAILLRRMDNSIVASEYLRTNGDPIAASIACYCSLNKQLEVPVRITGLGVTGSGRYISGLHAQTRGIINEIIAHAAATVYFDPEVDTIFEIGGQDAKYTYITAGVPSDYAMNEACSAGTGSFLEEAAKESLNIDYTEIGGIALLSEQPPNFNDQCSAFISSDIKNALHEGLSKEDIVAGLVYSVCQNYTNRVKGSRPVGNKVFMQGGVCYNKAVPVAMAALTGKEIVVPPEPGLMGAFGVALEIKKRLELNLIESEHFDLEQLINRRVEYGKSFICAGGSEKCDLKCRVAMIMVNGKKYPFGGSCNKYYNLQIKGGRDGQGSNLVRLRQNLVFEKHIYPVQLPQIAKTIGIPKSFLVNSLYPLFYNFFTQLGFRVILGDGPKTAGIEMKQAAFCYPVELAHGFMQDLLDKKPDYIFLPQITEIYNHESEFRDKTCVLLQSEKFYLQTAFKEKIKDVRFLSPVLNFSRGYASARNAFLKMAGDIGCSKPKASAAFDFSLATLNEMFEEFKEIGMAALSELEENSENFAVILMGRSYNAFAGEANLGIPQKFSSRNITIIPFDFLTTDSYQSVEHMYWGTGRALMRAARLIKSHPQLFAAYITNFSCGPDSFLIGYFRDIMEKKPSLTLELDSHSADAGINTRIEAFLDIVKSYRQLNSDEFNKIQGNGYLPLEVVNGSLIVDSSGQELSIFDHQVRLIVPNMGKLGAEAVAAAFRYAGINAHTLPAYDHETLKAGRGQATCKECLPLMLTAGSMVEYYEQREDSTERTLFFMAEGDGPCRFGQYHVFLNELIRKRQFKNIGVYTLSDENSYDALDSSFDRRSWAAVIISDVMQNMYHALNVLAVHRPGAINVFEREWHAILEKLESSTADELYAQLEKSALRLAGLEKKCSFADVPKVALIGEIFVRHDEFSRIDLIRRLTERNVIVKVAPISEYIHYSDYLFKAGNTSHRPSVKDKLKLYIRRVVKLNIEKNIRQILAKSGLCEFELTRIDKIIHAAKHLINPALAGEAILTVGTALHEILDRVAGVISIGPFGCMPSRVAEAVLNVEMNIRGKSESEGKKYSITGNEINELPYLAIETDGNLFPQIIQSKIEIFLLQAERLHHKLQSADKRTRMEYVDKYRTLIKEIGHIVPGEAVPAPGTDPVQLPVTKQ